MKIPVEAMVGVILLLLLVTLANAQDRDLDAGKELYKTGAGPCSVDAVKLITLHDAKRDKDLQLRVSYPKEAGEYPVIVWSHGATGTKDMYDPIVTHWVSHGYVCIQANHSDSRAFGEKGQLEVFRDWASRPKDIAFVLDTLDEIEKQVELLNGKMDKKTIGVGGHSFGAHSAQLVGGVTTVDPFSKERVNHADRRPKAFVLLSPQGTGEMLDKDSWKNLTRPAIVITGSNDPGRKGEPYTWRLEPFKYAPPGDKYLLFIEGAYHGFGGVVGKDTFTNAGPDNPDHMNYVKATTLAFWDTYLKESKEAKAFLNGDALEKKSKGKARIEVKNQAVEKNSYKLGPGEFTEATEDADWYDKKRERNVPVRIYAPDLKHGEGPFPVIVFSHGGGESRASFTYLGECWAQHGYIVVFVTHEGHDDKALQKKLKEGKHWSQAMGSPEDFPQRPADVSFVIDRLVSEDPGSKLLKGRINPDLICAAGQCAGSTTALAIVGLTASMPEDPKMSFRDRRVKIAIALSPQVAGRKTEIGLREDSWESVVTPALVIAGTKDFMWFPAVKANPKLRRIAYDGMPPGDKYLVDIKDAEHHAFTDSKPYYPGGERDPRHHGWIQQATTAYLDGYLKGNDSAVSWLQNKELEAATNGECKQEHKPYDFSPIDKYIEKSLSRIDGGCSLILVRGNRIIYRKAYGNFTPEKVVPIASASKWISGGVIMSLVDEGKIILDDKASKYLPDFTDKRGEITIRQMFSHTHGFPDKPTHHRDTRLTMKEAVEKIAKVDLVVDPGTALYYSGLGMQVAGRICEITVGKQWTKIFEEKIAGPLEMKNTDYYAFGETKNPNVAGSVRTCMDDYGNFVMMVLNQGLFKGQRVLSEGAVSAMLRNQSGDVKVLKHPYAPHSEVDPALGKCPYGIGCWLEKYDKKTGEAWEISSGGAFGCMPFVDLKRNLAGVYLPYGRTMKKDPEGTPYNDAARVYFELKPIIAAVMDGKATGRDGAAEEPEKKDAGEEADADARQRAERAIRFLDKDGDSQLSRNEMPARLTRMFDRIDADGNKKVSTDEFARFLGMFDRQQGRQQPEKKEEPQKKQEKKEEQEKQNGLYESGAGTHEVGTVKLVTLQDTKRGKDLQVRIAYPKGDGKFPVIVFSQCVGGSRNDYQPLVEHWVKNGYVVILADHSDSPEVGGGGPQLDWQNRALDMSFVLDSLGELEKKAPELKGKMDEKRIGAGGHLIGAYASCTLAGQKNFNPGASKDLKDERVKAALLLSPQGRGQGLTEKSWEGIGIPMMVLSGSKIPSRRTGNPAEWRKEPFTFSPPGDKYLVWIEGLDGKYAGLIDGKEGREDMAGWVKAATLAFWDAFLKEEKRAGDYLNSDSLQKASGGKATITAKQKTPSVPIEKLKENAGKAADYSAKHKGLAVLVMLDGETVFERYDNGHSAEKANHIHSATKSFWGVAAAAMIEDKLLSSFDELASKTISEWKNDRLKSSITVRHLLNLTAGLVQDIPALQGFDGTAKDKYAYSVGLRAVTVPGKRFQYGPSCFYVLGELMKRKLKDKKETPLDYLKRRIFKPIGLEVADWKLDPSGNAHVPNGAYITAREWAKFGQFLLQDGKWDGKQVVKAELLKECFKPCEANKGYGLTFWLNVPGGNGPEHLPMKSKAGDEGGFILPDGFPDIAGALGAGKNRMYIIPSLKMVVVRQAEGDRLGYTDADFLRLLLKDIDAR